MILVIWRTFGTGTFIRKKKMTETFDCNELNQIDILTLVVNGDSVLRIKE